MNSLHAVRLLTFAALLAGRATLAQDQDDPAKLKATIETLNKEITELKKDDPAKLKATIETLNKEITELKKDDPAKLKATIDSLNKQVAELKKDDPAKLKASIAVLQGEATKSKLKVSTLELEKLGARVSIDKPKEGPEITTVNILRVWSGDKDGLARLKELPNVQVVYVDNSTFNDASVRGL